jgi:hypothetical protein
MQVKKINLENELRPSQIRAFRRAEREIFYGGGKGGGKTHLGVIWMLEPVFVSPKYKGMVIRKSREDLKHWVSIAQEFYPKILGSGAFQLTSKNEFVFANGAKIMLSYYDENPATLNTHWGIEYDRMNFDELPSLPSEQPYLDLLLSLRTTTKELRPYNQILCTGNPGTIGQKWVADRFVNVGPEGKTFKDDYDLSRVYIFSDVRDNPDYFEGGKGEYFRFLQGLSGVKKRQWLEGDWGAFDMEGAYYTEEINKMIDEERYGEHIKYNPQKPVDTYWDLADNHDLNVVIFAQNNGDFVDIIDYYEITGVGSKVIANELFSRGYLFARHYAPHDSQQKRMSETAVRSKADLFRAEGISFTTVGKTSVESGVDAVRLLFSKFRIAKNKNTDVFLGRLRNYRKKENLNTGLLTEVHDINSHAADAIRYLAVTVKLNQSEYFAKNENSVANTKNLLSI